MSQFNQIVDDSQKYTTVLTDGVVGPGNAHHEYEIQAKNGRVLGTISFQNGPIQEVGVTGVTNEDLLAIVIDRLKGFQSGPYACMDNGVAQSQIEAGLHALQNRTRGREARGVEGTHAV